uniref:BTB domain-containing protein n=1 Tax=Kalanchoe fedtschenkoi TaxID=63787 RepID=A0A7N0T215_KALFE
MEMPASQISDNDRGSGELRALDCNLTSLCDHVQMEGFNLGSFSDIVVHAMGSTYHLHRLILSRSSYFRNMLQGPWKESNAATVTLLIDDKNVNGEAVTMALAYLYGYHPKLNDDNAFRVLAAASFLDLQDLCALCTEFIVSELWTSNFLAYQIFAESQDYGIHGERVRSACWGYLCQCGALELKEMLPRLSSQTLQALLTSNNLWIPNEEARFELAVYALLLKGSLYNVDHPGQGSSSSENTICIKNDLFTLKGKAIVNTSFDKSLESELGRMSLNGNLDGHNAPQKVMPGRANCVMNLLSEVSNSRVRASGGLVEMPDDAGTSSPHANFIPMEGPSGEKSYLLDDWSWVPRNQPGQCSSVGSSCNRCMRNWGRYGNPDLPEGGRLGGNEQVVGYASENGLVHDEEDTTFRKIFEGGSLFYCNMSFEALLNVRKQLEELAFPCKALNDGLWLQMLLTQKVQEIGADTCKNCCLVSSQCACRQTIRYPHGIPNTGYYMQDNDVNTSSDSIGNVYVTESGQGEGHRLFRPVRVHVRGPNDGLAGLGRGATFVQDGDWPPTRVVFSRVPYGMGNRNYQQSLGNDDMEPRANLSADLTGDGLTALVGLSQGGNSSANFGGEHPSIQTFTPGSGACNSPVQMVESSEDSLGFEWDNANTSISLDMKTPLSHFPPFRFGVEFIDVHRLSDGQVKHSPEVFYAGSLWKVSVQAFNDEDLQGRRTLGLFLHRRKAEMTDLSRKVHMYVDSREKVTARYQLICPSKREVLEFGRFKQPGTLLPKAPKGWGWRTALLFDELGDLLQNGALRVVAVVQVV